MKKLFVLLLSMLATNVSAEGLQVSKQSYCTDWFAAIEVYETTRLRGFKEGQEFFNLMVKEGKCGRSSRVSESNLRRLLRAPIQGGVWTVEILYFNAMWFIQIRTPLQKSLKT